MPIHSFDSLPTVAAPLRVLLVDDNALNLLVAREMLVSLGATVDTAADGAQALELMDCEQFDLVFMDVHMPVLDGLAATIQLRERERNRKENHTTVIALTANAMMGDRERCLAAGMDDYLAKPVRREQLAAMLLRYAPRHPQDIK